MATGASGVPVTTRSVPEHVADLGDRLRGAVPEKTMVRAPMLLSRLRMVVSRDVHNEDLLPEG